MPIQSQADGSRLDQFWGSWALVSYECVLPSGEMLQLFGDHPTGMLAYQAGGCMSVQISAGNPSRFASDDFLEVSSEEAAAAWRNYFGYWGTFQIDADRSTIAHRVEGSSFANWIGTEQTRQFRFDESGQLILETESSAGRYTLTWRRKSA